MNHPKINVKESINKQRVVFDASTLHDINEFLVEMAFLLPFPVIGGSFVYFEIQKFYSEYLTEAILFFIFSVTYGGLIGYSMINNENLVRVGGRDIATNRAFIITIAKENKWKVIENRNHLTLLSTGWEMISTHWGRRIVIINDQNDILINSIAYGLFDIKSPFHWFGNREVERELINYFNDKIEHAT